MRQRRIRPEILREIRGDVVAVLLVDILQQITKAGAHVIHAIVPAGFVPHLRGHAALKTVATEASCSQLVPAASLGQELLALIDREIGPVYGSLLQRDFVSGVLPGGQLNARPRLEAISDGPHQQLILPLWQIFNAIVPVLVGQDVSSNSRIHILGFNERTLERFSIGTLHRARNSSAVSIRRERKHQRNQSRATLHTGRMDPPYSTCRWARLWWNDMKCINGMTSKLGHVLTRNLAGKEVGCKD